MIELAIPGRTRDLGGFEVKRILPFAKKRTVGPFIFLDEMGPAKFNPGSGIDVRPHPHIGLSTVTYLFEGRIVHRDSLGVHQEIIPGEVNWMTAGKGVVHSERTHPHDRESGFQMHGLQIWVALPVQDEDVEPSFHHHKSKELPEFQIGNVSVKLILGTAYGYASPVKTYSEMFYLDLNCPKNADLKWPATQNESALYLVKGKGRIGDQNLEPGTLYVFKKNMDITIHATEEMRAVIIGGAPLDGDREIYWNFVASSKDKIEAAKRKWQAQEFPKVPGETEFIPLPD